MTLRALSREEVRHVDRRAIEEYGLPGIVLMENAGRGLSNVLVGSGGVKQGERTIVCCGKGNNGGDGFVLARHHESRGYDVEVLLFADPEEIGGDAAANLAVLRRAGTSVRVLGRDFELDDLDAELARADHVVDALLGTGTRGEVREPFGTVIEAITRRGSFVLAVDLPSGLDCDSGEALGPTVRADVTATFVAPKLGFESESAKPHLGEVRVLDIGVPKSLLDEFVTS